MAATEKMRMYAIVIAVAMGIPFPEFEDFDETREFISKYDEGYRGLPSKLRKEKREEAKMYFYAVYDLENFKLKLKTGNWIKKKFSEKEPPFDSLDSLNAINRIKMAKEFWNELTQDIPGFKLVESLDGEPISLDELIIHIAKDLDYRVAKATAKYFFGKTSKSAGAVMINPDKPPFDAVKFQFRETYYRLDDEFTYRGVNNTEFRTPIKNKQDE